MAEQQAAGGTTGGGRTREKRSRRAARHVFGVREGIAGTVYGTIVAMATLTAGATSGRNPFQLAALVMSTALVLWVAHVYAHAISESIAVKHKLDRAELRSVAGRELAIPLAAAAPAAVLVLGGLDAVRDSTAIWLALGLGLGTLAAQGARYARVQGLDGLGMLWTVSLNLALGLAIIGLKVFVGHV